MNKPLFTGSDWNFELLESVLAVLTKLAQELKLDIYPNQIEVISSEQMLDAYASTGLPVMYRHWSFGKRFSQERDQYRTGRSGLAYELVLNSNPCINYLMEENSATMQTLVLAHAAFGHNHFFKNNYSFQNTPADSIIDYLVFARNYIDQCEEKHGAAEVERTLDHAHALQSQGVDRQNRAKRKSLALEKSQQSERAAYLDTQVNELWSRTVPGAGSDKKITSEERFPARPEENLLYFLEKHSPVLKPWQREILRIVRKVSQYLEPQRSTKVMNEGWATFVHYYLMNRLHDQGHITDGSMLEFLKSHSGVVFQPSFDSPYFSGNFNPYYLGFEMFREIRRVCESPTAEDAEYFPNLVNQPWIDVCLDAVANYRDESFIQQFLTPALVRKMRLFRLRDQKHKAFYAVTGIHDDRGFREIRSALARSYDVTSYMPRIEVARADLKSSRTLTLHYYQHENRNLDSSYSAVLAHVQALWGHPVELVQVTDTGTSLIERLN
jgi:stage V sporulation protein R